MPENCSSDVLLAEQVAYYRARSAEYDQWWQRQGRFDRGVEIAPLIARTNSTRISAV